MTERIKPSELEAEAQRLIVEGKMPSLQGLLDAIAETREEYQQKILDARNRKSEKP